jgi:DNA-binding transcriptional regulator YhcF (GntR family)
MTKIKSKKLNALELADVIRSEINHGMLRPGDRIEPIRTLAERFHVGRGIAYTAIEALKKDGLLTSKGRSGIYVSENQSGSNYAKRPRIGFYVHIRAVTEDLYSMFHALSSYGLMTGCDVTLGYINGSLKLAKWASGLDALLVTGYVDEPLISELKDIGLPFIVIGNYQWEAECNVLRFNLKESIRKVIAETYSKLKFETFGMFLCSPELYAVREAIEAVREMQKTCPFKLSEDDILFEPSEDGYKSMKLIMMRPPNRRPRAIMLSYQSIFGAARYIYECNIKSLDRPILICKVQENFSKMMPGIPDVSIVDDSYLSLARESIDWLMSLLHNPQNAGKYETRTHFSPEKIIFN